MENRILELLHRPDYTPQTALELLTNLKFQRNQLRELEHVLNRLERNGQVARIKQGNRYSLPLDADLIPGRIRINRQGAGTLQPDDPKLPALRIPPDATATAMHGDHVLVRRDRVPRPGGRPGAQEATGRVVRVLERARGQIVGTLQRSKQFLYVIPDDPRIPQDIYVPPPKDVGRPARVGDKVVVELLEWQSRHTNPEGEIVEVLGSPDAEGVDMLSVIRQYQLSLHFPKHVLQEARAIGDKVAPAEIVGRIDCRNHNVVTIDPEDAKDFDDAICLERAGGGQWKLWVHIADVSHYIKPGSALDEEAKRRGNSTYLVDRVVPMLPEALSNELCSLKPHVERLTKCVEFLLSDDGQVLRTQFYPAVICSRHRYNYKEVLAILTGGKRGDAERKWHGGKGGRRGPSLLTSASTIPKMTSAPTITKAASGAAGSDGVIEEMLHDAHALAQKIRRARFKAGSLDLDFPETKIRLNDEGRVERIEKVENDISHQLIEEFMLLANEAVAARLMALNRPAIYRIHEPPDERRLQEYREEVLGHNVHCGNLSNRREVQKLLEKLNTLPIGEALKIGFLRSLMRARYAVEPLGHYGLAKKKYTHFTSPIRRYADLVVHRALFPETTHPRAEKHGSDSAQLDSNLARVADHISETERNSADAERDSRDVKLFAFLQAQLSSASPKGYPALVTDVRNFGFFVDVQGLGMSGLVPLSGLNDDFYQLDQRRAQLVGRRTRRVIKLGDRVEVQVAKVDTFKRQVDFKIRSPKVLADGHQVRTKAEIRTPRFERKSRGERKEFKGFKRGFYRGKREIRGRT
jgi:ribonuclease R